MITRKLKRPLDRYINAVEEGSDFANRRAQFYHSLRAFYRRRWGCNFKAPHVSGVELDLYRLYECVKEFGGWQKVTSGDRWSEVLNALSIPDDEVQVARHAVNTLYMRYLSRFEQSETGNDADGDDSDLHSGRSRLKLLSSFINTESPISIPRGAAQSSSLQQQRSTASNFDKLLKSLLSGLPNEVDFGINVCTLLSHPGPYSLKLPDAPQSALISALVAHCGVFADGANSLEDIHLNAWRKQSGHDFLEFWRQAGIEDEEVLSLLSPQIRVSVAHCSTKHNVGLFAEEDDKLELKKPANWRVFQVLSVFRNLSFEQANRRPMASNLPLLKFLLCCCNSRWIQLRNAAFDTLSNTASEIDLTSNESILTNNLLLKATSEALHSQDKFKVLRALEILTGLSMSRKNEPILCARTQLGPRRLIDRIFALVTAQDVLLCTFTLEYIYWASELGRASCDVICGCSHGVDTLVNFATTWSSRFRDAASFGTMGIAGMKVVEINGVTGHLQPYHPQRATSNQPPLLTSQLIPRHDSARSPPPTPLVPNSIASSSSTTKQTPPPALVPQVAASDVESTIAPKRNHKEAAGESRLERLTREWIEGNCDLRADGTANRGEMYACYAEAIQREHSMMAGSMQMFITKLRSSFPSIGISNQPGSSVHIVEGLVFKGRSSNLGSFKRESINLAAQHPLMQQILSESSKGDKEPHCSASPSPSSRSPATTNQHDNGELKTEIASESRQDPIKGGDQASTTPPSPLLNGVEEVTLNGDLREEHKLRASARIAATKRANGKNRKEEGLNGETTLCNGGIATTQANSDANGTNHRESRKHHSSPAATHASKRARGSTRTTSSSTSSDQEAIVYRAAAPAPSTLTQDSQPQPVPAFAGPIDLNTPSTSTSTGDLMCEWNCCGRMFVSAEAVLYHHTEYHLREEKNTHPVDSGADSDREELIDEELLPIICRWPSCSTDNTPRSKWSMVTHLQDHHCSEPHLQATMAKRLEMGHQNYLAHLQQQLDRNKEAAHHPIGYSKFAAVEAIRRHAFSYLAKDVTEDSEGPVTKSLRLTSSLILRNIARYSAEGRRKLQKHEARLAWMAGSRMEASTVLAQTLAELAKHQKQPCTGNFSGIQNAPR